MQTNTQAITLILSIGTIVLPVIFGFVVWKMSQIFVSKEDWNSWKLDRMSKDGDMKKEIDKISEKIDRLIERKHHE